MNLKIDFIKAITTSIIDRNKRDCFLKVKNEKISSKQSVPTLTNSPNFDSLKEKEKTFFDLLITNNGLYSVCDWLLLKCISNNNNINNTQIKTEESSENIKNKNTLKIEKMSEEIELDEFQVLKVFKDIYSEVFEYKIYELFEIYELKPNTKLGAKEIYLIILFSAALESHQVLEFIYLFGNLLYNLISGGNDTLYGIRMRQFMKLIGFSERIIGKNLKNIDIFDDKEYGFEEFEILMFSFFEEKENFKSLDIVLEKENPQNKSNPITTNKKESGLKYKTCKGLCSIF